jgi:hypothetical protein
MSEALPTLLPVIYREPFFHCAGNVRHLRRCSADGKGFAKV